MHCALAPSVSRLEPLGEHLLVFDEATWDTHVLNPSAAALLLAIAEQPRSLEELTAYLADLLAADQAPHAASHAESTVQQLQSLGLVTLQEQTL